MLAFVVSIRSSCQISETHRNKDDFDSNFLSFRATKAHKPWHSKYWQFKQKIPNLKVDICIINYSNASTPLVGSRAIWVGLRLFSITIAFSLWMPLSSPNFLYLCNSGPSVYMLSSKRVQSCLIWFPLMPQAWNLCKLFLNDSLWPSVAILRCITQIGVLCCKDC